MGFQFDYTEIADPGFCVPRELGLIIDNFSGGGGASTAMEVAMGREVDIAINHDADAIAMHKANHPNTEHFIEDVWEVDPEKAAAGRPVFAAWFSPDCKHFSRAAGRTPKNKNIRGLAWVVIRWASLPEWQRPRVIFLENVAEFQEWSPVTKDGRIDRRYRKGSTYRKFLKKLRTLGYSVETKLLKADDYGAGTIRKRLFMVARYDGADIVWPKPTHGDPKKYPNRKPWVPAHEIIDWTIPCPSIFDRKRPLAENTQRRIAAGLKKFVIDNPDPFIVKVNHAYPQFRGQSIHEPLQTVTSKNGYGLVSPIIDRQFGTSRGASVETPLGTVMTQGAGKSAVVTPTLIQMGYGEREGQAPRVLDLEKPIGTVTAGGNKFAVAAPMIQHVAHTSKKQGCMPADEPLRTITARPKGGSLAVTTAFMAQHNTGVVGRSAEAPVSTILSAGCHQQPVEVELAPDGTEAADRAAEVHAFLLKFYGSKQGGCDIEEPLHTVTTKDRFGIVVIEGQKYRIVDIGMRMLTPRELFRAMGFPEDYDILEGELSKAKQVAKAGNAVSPHPAIALARANVAQYLVPVNDNQQEREAA